ncbi:L,D-transpeptidase family protein [Pontibacter sp. BT310]|uniref:L,D-transpeptidase family protein n=1 Tax=Pontibacter populi TaxID=890055 RepID=A0ABS6XFE4_9BACT|nr:L,D-transpeptidase family protein [Pontibacter sp. BT310]MBR0572187.1 L,D-transpeptidase family protein [Microvirga sp. STS03]MBW3366611.1 L,D-transpeptidase family protein [Pontibacter populi]
MNPYHIKSKIFYPFIVLLLIFVFSACNKSGDKKDGNKIGEMLGIKELPQATTDSLYIKEYISKKPAFKAYDDLMYLFYGERDYSLAWFRDNELIPEAQKFLTTLDDASKEGLDPKKYKLVDFKTLFKKYEDMSGQDSARLELQQQIDVGLTASYFNYASDFYRGRVNPGEVGSIDWNVKKNKIKLHKALQTILKERESTYPYYEFEALHKGYIDLRETLQKYRDLQEKGGWAKVELGKAKVLEKGDTAAAVIQLRKRLNPGGVINVNDPKMRLFDDALLAQVKEFQRLHGLAEDGKVGGNTLRMMNVPIEDRIQQIMMNMERWRWIPKRLVPKSLDQKYIWVNIPEFKLYMYEDPDNDPEAEREYKKTFEMKVIVGKELNSTPIFSDKMEFIVLAPYWNVPNSIVEKEIKPAMLRNPNYLEGADMEIVTKEKDPKPISASSIDWASVTEKNFPYMVRQRPGPTNSLGNIKFLFPNSYNVYLHDTPADALFNQTERGFSHGCVRLEKPIELGEYLLKDMPEWNAQRIRQTIEDGEETWITLPKKLQVYLVYFTSWVDEDGKVHFRDDIYGHDKKLAKEYFG